MILLKKHIERHRRSITEPGLKRVNVGGMTSYKSVGYCPSVPGDKAVLNFSPLHRRWAFFGYLHHIEIVMLQRAPDVILRSKKY